ncbi:MAG: hypothetical protein IKQ97_10060 [Eubacterium sp.]|nr:hypothetical protein [Eubacterium sp.]
MIHPNINRRVFRLMASSLAAICCLSCVNVNKELGEDYIAANQKFDIYTCDIDIDDIEMRQADSLSGLSLYRLTFGAVRDELFGLTTRATAFTLVPLMDTLDFGLPGTQVFREFHFTAVSDSISTADPSQANILQKVNVYELDKPIDLTSNKQDVSYIKKRITDGIPIYNGVDSLSFNFSKEFGEKFFGITQHDLDTITNYVKKFPGIYISTDEPTGNGGRINMFRLPIDVQDGYIYGSTATLKFSAQYKDKGLVDTSFVFYLGPTQIYDMADVTDTSPTNYPQLALDITTHESKSMEGKAGENIYFEGGKGLKPVIKANSLRKKIIEEISKHGDPNSIIVSKATITMPFDFPEDYTLMDQYPRIISPTTRIVADDKTVTFAGITDASISTENQGEINRSLGVYAPDISHHVQEMVKLKNLDKIDNYDVWFLATREEVITQSNSNSSNSNMSDFYNQMAYASYYNDMYGYGGYGGYGYGGYGYGGYGGYGGYSNYYSYMMLAQMYSSANSGTQQTTQTLMDFHRFYKGVLKGPASSGDKPKLSLTYAVPAE